jgi:hypothetical protein
MSSRPRSRARPGRIGDAGHSGQTSTPVARGVWGHLAGGTEGNERLTVLTGLLLLVMLAPLGVTIVRIGQLLWLHLFLGLVLMGPVILKLASTGYRFFRYYTGNRRYGAKGPPGTALRVLAPLVVSLTVVVFATGVALLLIGPDSSVRDTMVLIHKVSFIAWLAFTAIHVVGHVPELIRFNRVSDATRAEINALRAGIPGFGGPAPPPLAGRLPGGQGRWLSVGTAVVLGLVLALVLLPQFAAWTGANVVLHHHHRG